MKKDISYLKLLRLLLSKWLWLFTALIAGVLLGYVYLGLNSRIYCSSSTLKFEDRKSELSELTSIRNLYERTNKIESEKLIIRSARVIKAALIALNYDTEFYTEEKLSLSNTYPKKPLTIDILHKEATAIPARFKFQQINTRKYLLSYPDQDGAEIEREYHYGELVKHDQISFRINHSNTSSTDPVFFHFTYEPDLIEKINKALKIQDHQNVNVIGLSLTDPNPYFATDMLNAIIAQYLNFDKMLHSSSASQTEIFISNMLAQLSCNSTAAADKLQQFKSTNPSGNIDELNSKLHLLENEKHALKLQELNIGFLKQSISTAASSYNQNLQGITDPQLNILLSKLNDLIAKKHDKLIQLQPANPGILELNLQIAVLKENIQSNINSQHKLLNEKNEYLTLEIANLKNQLKKLPFSDRIYTDLQSKVDIQNKVNTYLEEKKLEAQISKSAVTPIAIVIDPATYPTGPIAPIPKNIYTISILGCLLTAICIVLFIQLNNPYIHNPEEIEELTDIPVVGIIRQHYQLLQHPIPSISIPRSAFSESIRGLRSNLNFLPTEQSCKVIYLSSEISGEGKSFIALNLAIALSLTDKKVLLIAADLRKSNLHEILQIDNNIGLTNYLSGQASGNELIKTTLLENLHFIPSGISPPNPSELLLNQRMNDLLTDLKDVYDFILLDSAPIGLVSDGKPLIKLADISLFILRSGLSRHSFVSTAEKLKKEFQLQNIALILNGFEENKYHSPYQYRTNQYQDYLEL